MSIGKNIAKFRKQLNLTQEELGEKLGVTNQAVSKWENGVSLR
jgi:transcriptional regulator with XRE-family HTH domain